MSVTFDNIDARGAKAKPVSTFPTVYEWYGEGLGQEATTPAWVGGEMIFYTGTNKFFVQTATSGQIATWKQLGTAWATTTSTSTSTSSSTSSTTSTTTSSSTSSSTTTSTSSTSTSTSTTTSSSTSTSTSSSSTTTP